MNAIYLTFFSAYWIFFYSHSNADKKQTKKTLQSVFEDRHIDNTKYPFRFWIEADMTRIIQFSPLEFYSYNEWAFLQDRRICRNSRLTISQLFYTVKGYSVLS